jgi:hypothetical protein
MRRFRSVSRGPARVLAQATAGPEGGEIRADVAYAPLGAEIGDELRHYI